MGGSSGAEVSPRCHYIGFLIPSFIDFEEHHQVAYSRDNTTASFLGEMPGKKAHCSSTAPCEITVSQSVFYYYHAQLSVNVVF